MIPALFVALCLSVDPPPRTDTFKKLMKEAAGGSAVGTDGGPDVSTLPFTAESIKQIVMSHQPQIQGCYEDHLSSKKKAPEGTIKTAFTITPEGMVKSARVDSKGSTLKDPALSDCVVAVLSTMAFPKPPDSKDHPIQFPFNLKAVH